MNTSVNDNVKDLKEGVYLLLFVALFSMVFKVVWIVPLLICSCMVLIINKEKLQKVSIPFSIAFIISLFRGIAVVFLYISMTSTPPFYKNFTDYRLRNPILWFYSWQEIGLAEAIIRDHTIEVRSHTINPSIRIDNFSGDCLKKTNENFYYSIGPDQKDNHGTIHYDPTNGIISSGDIFYKR